MSDFSSYTRSRCPRCKAVFSSDDGIPCNCFDDEIEEEYLMEEYEDQMAHGEIDEDLMYEEWRDSK